MIDDSRPRVGFVLAGTGTGGAERFLLRVILRLKDELQPVIFVRGTRRGDLHDQFVDSGAEVIYLKLGYLDPIGTYRFIRLLKTHHLRSLVDFSGIFAGLTLLAAKRAGIHRRIVFHRRSSFGFEPTWLRLLYARISTYLTEQVATHILANSQAALDFFHPRLSGNDQRLAVIRNFIDPEELQPTRTREEVREELNIPQDAFVVLHTARLDPAKDHQTLLKASAAAMLEDDEVFCVLAGRKTDELKQYVAFTWPPLRPRFRFVGNRRDVPDLLNASDIFVFPSITEGQPNSLVEAILVGLPVIASDIAPIKEVIPSGAHSLLIPAGDQFAFRDAILQSKYDFSARDARVFKEWTLSQMDHEEIADKLYGFFC